MLLNEEPGFDPFTPIQLSFDAPVDLDTLRVNRSRDPAEHSIFLFNVEVGSERFGERVTLDFGSGLFPTSRLPRTFFPTDPLVDEPTSCSTRRTARTSTRTRPTPCGCGRPTRWRSSRRTPRRDDACARGQRRARAFTHAPSVALDGQEDELDPVVPMLRELGVAPDEIAWAYAFTTGAPTRQLERIHDGLVDGRGPLAYLRDRFPPTPHDPAGLARPARRRARLERQRLCSTPQPVEALARIAIPLVGATPR